MKEQASPSSKILTRGQLAKQLGLNAEAIRYYEKQGILDPADRSEAGYRLYNEAAVSRLVFVKKAQSLGFSLAEIKELLNLKVKPKAGQEEVREQIGNKIAQLDQKIQDLHHIRGLLQALLESCTGSGTVDTCPIIRTLEKS